MIYSFPLDRMLIYDSSNKSILTNGEPNDNSESSAIVVYQQAAHINLKIGNRSLIVSKTY